MTVLQDFLPAVPLWQAGKRSLSKDEVQLRIRRQFLPQGQQGVNGPGWPFPSQLAVIHRQARHAFDRQAHHVQPLLCADLWRGPVWRNRSRYKAHLVQSAAFQYFDGTAQVADVHRIESAAEDARSEERRVGKECRSRW